jgi:hypothetical protein
MSPPFIDTSKIPQPIYTFESGQKFLQFLRPDDSDETLKLLQNRAQCRLSLRIGQLLQNNQTRKRYKLDTDHEKNWIKVLAAEPKGGYDLWWNKLKEETKLSDVEEDAICLGDAFGNKKMAWRLTQYPSVEKFVASPYYYSRLLIFVIKSDSAEDRAAQHPIEQGHTSINKTREDQLGGTIPPLNPQPTCKGPANECGNIVGDLTVVQEAPQRNGKRPNVEDIHESKRICLESGQSYTHGANDAMLAKDAVSTSIPVPDQDRYMYTGPEHSAGVETPAPTGRRSTIHSLMLVPQAPTIEDISPNSEYLDQTGSAEPMRNDGSALDRHTSTHEYNVYHVREDKLIQTPGILDNSNPWSDPNYTLDEPNRELSNLASIGVEELDGTGDSIVTYRWGGSEALECIGQDAHSVNDGKWCYINMALCELPFKKLAETIKQSSMWKSEKLEISTKTSCLTLRLRRRVIDRYCDLDCIVPTAMVPQVRGIQRRDDHAQ